MHDMDKLRVAGTKSRIIISPAEHGGFTVRKDPMSLGMAMSEVAACSTVAELEYIIGEIYRGQVARQATDFAEVGEGEKAEPADTRGHTSAMAHALFVVTVVDRTGQEMDFAVPSREAASLAVDMVRYATKASDGDAWISKDRDGEACTSQEPSEPDTNETRYVVLSGTTEDPEKTATCFYDEETAKRACEMVWQAGGRARFLPTFSV